MKQCCICNGEFSENHPPSSVFVEAGEWLSDELWKDGGSLCPQCLENRAKLAMMYLHEYNT